jgi:pimeloyl-ACP methyl ester carboxylesterase
MAAGTKLAAIAGFGVMCVAVLGGCASRPANPQTRDVLFFVPGAAGDGGHYDGLVRGLRAGGLGEHMEVVTWGAPGPLFVLNFQDDKIHRAAEEKLAEALKAWRASHAGGRIDVIAHSAGCGVVLGALRGDGVPEVRTVVLLNPSVSPAYPLEPSLRHVTGRLHVFHSDRDTVFLSWRTRTFGTYDNVKTRAAGNVGFELDGLSPEARAKAVQHGREPWWDEQGNNGGHFGTVKECFVKTTVAPLLVP